MTDRIYEFSPRLTGQSFSGEMRRSTYKKSGSPKTFKKSFLRYLRRRKECAAHELIGCGPSFFAWRRHAISFWCTCVHGQSTGRTSYQNNCLFLRQTADPKYQLAHKTLSSRKGIRYPAFLSSGALTNSYDNRSGIAAAAGTAAAAATPTKTAPRSRRDYTSLPSPTTEYNWGSWNGFWRRG